MAMLRGLPRRERPSTSPRGCALVAHTGAVSGSQSGREVLGLAAAEATIPRLGRLDEGAPPGHKSQVASPRSCNLRQPES